MTTRISLLAGAALGALLAGCPVEEQPRQGCTTDDECAEGEVCTAARRCEAVEPPAGIIDLEPVALDEDQVLELPLDRAGLEGELSFAVVAPPAHGQLTLEDGTARYAPAQDFFGEDSFVYLVANEQQTAQRRLLLLVGPVNDPPAFVGASLSTDEDTPLRVPLAAEDVDGDAVSFSIAAGGGEVSLEGDEVLVVPPPDDASPIAFRVVASDGAAQVEAAFDVTVVPVDDAPRLSDLDLAAVEDTSLDVALPATDPDGEALAYTVTTAPGRGTVEIDGALARYAPLADASGDDSFVVEARDPGGLAASATVRVTIAPVDDPPTAADTGIDVPLVGAAPAELPGADPEGAALAFSVVEQPLHGAVSLSGAFAVYTPARPHPGLDRFVFSVSDGTSEATATAFVRVERDEAPVRASCASILNSRVLSRDGVEVLEVPGQAGTYEAFCDQTTGGGGFTLAAKVDGRLGTWAYDAALWTDATLLNEASPDLDAVEAKLASFTGLPVEDVLVSFEHPIGSGARRSVRLQVEAASLRALFADGTFVPTSLGREAWKALFDGSSLQLYCNREGFNVVDDTPFRKVRIGILANQEGDCGNPDSYIGVGHSPHLNFNAGSAGNFSHPNYPGDNGAVAIQAMAAVFVRSRDFTAMDARASCLEHAAAGRLLPGRYLVDPGSGPVTIECAFDRGACPPGAHDDGTGACALASSCAAGHHDGGDGRCVAFGSCAPGFRLDGQGRCLPE